MNKVIVAIDRAEKMIAENTIKNNLTPAKLNELNKNLDMDISEYVKYQELKNIAMVNNVLTLDETNTIYGYLGNTPEDFNGQSLAVKITLTKLFSELLSMKINKKF
jgi:hypothetical protein